MPSISFDGQSFMVDGRRIWLVGGAIHYPRTPRALWRRRILAAKQAGLNCIETYVFWNLHEPEPGRFDFEGDRDLRHFIELIAAEGMYCILRPGPYVCSEWDFGGLPPWLLNIPELRLRQANAPFNEACARYIGAVMAQVRDLQVTAPRSPGAAAGPIVMMQAENEWFCHHPQQAQAYLHELVRYLRENGCDVPINVCNNLWQRVDGTIDTWNASRHLLSDLRQLRVVQPEAPRLVSEFWTGWFDQWNGPHVADHSAGLTQLRMAGITAVGGQYNLYMFHGGTNFGFYGGRTVNGDACFMTTSYDYDAPLLEAGGRGEKYLAVKRLSTFCSQFGYVLAHLNPRGGHAAVNLDERQPPVSVIHQGGTQGEVVFILRPLEDRSREVSVLLPSGIQLPVPMGDESAAWILAGVNLAGQAELTYTNLRPWAFLEGRLLVLYGPPGAEGIVCLDEADIHVRVPNDNAPFIERTEAITLLVLNRRQVDAAYVTEEGVVIGASELNEDGQPIPWPRWTGGMKLVTPDGTITTIPRPRPRGGRRANAAPRLSRPQPLPCAELVAPEEAGYRDIPGPASLEALDCPFGYGWYRLSMQKAARGRMLAPHAADRLHLIPASTQGSKAQPATLLGAGPGAVGEPTALRLSGQVTVLADNLGRFNYGWHVGERKGLYGHFHTVKPIAAGKPKVDRAHGPDPFELRGFWQGLRIGQKPEGDQLTFTFRAAKKPGVIVDIGRLAHRALVLLNGQALDMFDPHYSAGIGRWLLTEEHGLVGGRNQLALALFDSLDARRRRAAASAVRLLQSTGEPTAQAQWQFKPWTVPAASDFENAADTAMPPGLPGWFRLTFTVSHTEQPLWLEATGLSKGQLILNGHNVGRYWVATADGTAVPPQSRYYLPEPWLRTDQPNELLIFDEHGRSPQACRLLYDALGPYNGPTARRAPS